jgi:AcrR family transcriptional regulator
MISRSKLLEAAARVYAECGFRGATTRRIAEEAGVNEVTIFRNFGSKAALIHEAVRCHAGPALPLPPLPEVPVDPERELLAWAAAYYAYLRDVAPLIRKTMGELEERPEAAPTMSGGAPDRASTLRHYFAGLHRHGWLDGGRAGVSHDFHAAAAMLMGTIFADAMGRDMMPPLFPQPERKALRLYVRLILRAIGYAGRDANTDDSGAAGEGARGPTLHPLHKRSTRHP